MAWTKKGGPLLDRSHHTLPLSWNQDDGSQVNLPLPMTEFETFVAAYDLTRIVTDLGDGRLSCRLHSPNGFLWAMRRCACINKAIKDELDGPALVSPLANGHQGAYMVRIPTGGKSETQPTFVVNLETSKFKGTVWATLFIYEPASGLMQDVIVSPSLGAVDLQYEGRYTLWRMTEPHWKKFLWGQARELELTCSSCGMPYWNPTWGPIIPNRDNLIHYMAQYIMLADHGQCYSCWQMTTELPDERN